MRLRPCLVSEPHFALAGGARHLRAPDSESAGLDLRLVAFGCERETETTQARSVQLGEKGRVKLVHDQLTEWYVSEPRGVEQGFDIPERPACGTDLVLRLDTGALAARAAEALP